MCGVIENGHARECVANKIGEGFETEDFCDKHGLGETVRGDLEERGRHAWARREAGPVKVIPTWGIVRGTKYTSRRRDPIVVY